MSASAATRAGHEALFAFADGMLLSPDRHHDILECSAPRAPLTCKSNTDASILVPTREIGLGGERLADQVTLRSGQRKPWEPKTTLVSRFLMFACRYVSSPNIPCWDTALGHWTMLCSLIEMCKQREQGGYCSKACYCCRNATTTDHRLLWNTARKYHKRSRWCDSERRCSFNLRACRIAHIDGSEQTLGVVDALMRRYARLPNLEPMVQLHRLHRLNTKAA